MKMRNLLLTLGVTVIGLFALTSNAIACGIFANQDECPSEFVR